MGTVNHDMHSGRVTLFVTLSCHGFWVPGLAETMTKGDMADVMVCLSNTRAHVRAS